jgi:hypothetical protein
MTKPIKITHYESGIAYENHPTKTMAGVEGGATDMNKHTEVEEIFGKECDTYEKDCPTCVVYKALTQAKQAGRDEAVEVLKGKRNGHCGKKDCLQACRNECNSRSRIQWQYNQQKVC